MALYSDHLPIQINIDCNPSLPPLNFYVVYNWKYFTNTINKAPPPFDNINYVQDIETAVTNLTKLIQNYLEASKCHQAPQNYQTLPHDKKLKLIIEIVIRLLQACGDPSIQTDLNLLNAIIKRDILNFKNNKWTDFIIFLTPTDNSLLNYMKRVRKPLTPIPPLNTNTGHKCLNTEKGEVLAYQYESQFQPHSDVFNADSIDWVEHIVSIFLARDVVRSIEPATPEEVIAVVKNLPNRKAPRHDGITNSAIKNLPID